MKLNIAVLLILMAFSINMHAINPEREYRFTPELRGLKYSEFQLQTPDNYKINVWEYTLPDSVKTNRTIIIVGTDAGNMGYTIWQAKAFLKKGIRVISFDYRGFGKSSDFTINKEFLFHSEFAIDLDTAIRYAREKFPDDKIGLYSLSMGTYISLIKNEETDFLIAEGFYNDPEKIVERIKVNKSETVLLPKRVKIVSTVKMPVMIFCADKDKTTTIQDAKDFATKNEAKIIEFDGEHLYGLSKFTKEEPGDEYASIVVSFLNQNRL